MYFNICTARTCTFGILITVKVNGILNTQAGFIVGVAVYKKEFGGEQRRQSVRDKETLFGRKITDDYGRTSQKHIEHGSFLDPKLDCYNKAF